MAVMRSRRRWAKSYRQDAVLVWLTPFELHGEQFQAGDALHPALRADEGMMRNFWMSRLIDFVGPDGFLVFSPGLLLNYLGCGQSAAGRKGRRNASGG